ncbi:tetraspanin-13-like [Limulus polyphemus]|uniref:Tetraspanin-13-like n=1 Tax=Limulus polyphemus TaxID=6850 RepID=A0ABM1B2U1_LIMPO|nr:tetraspanin-13-like [Limulus polyphemus]
MGIGYNWLKNILIIFNLFYTVVSFIVIGIATYGHAVSIISNLSIIGAVLSCGIFLFILSFVGLLGTIKHHQALLCFYMIVMALVCFMQFVTACVCLAMIDDQHYDLAQRGWMSSSPDMKDKAQRYFNCCGFNNATMHVGTNDTMDHPTCQGVLECCPKEESCACQPCWKILKDTVGYGLRLLGGVGLFFSFTLVCSIWFTQKYRNQRDPRYNPYVFM